MPWVLRLIVVFLVLNQGGAAFAIRKIAEQEACTNYGAGASPRATFTCHYEHREGRMRAWIATLVLAAEAAAHAQEGFPLDGTWRGELEGAKAHATVVMVLQWDGQKITGTINPGPDAIAISDAKLIPEGWHL